MQARKQEVLFFAGALLLGIGLMAATFAGDFDAVKSTEKYSSTMYPRIIICGWLLTASIAFVKALSRFGEPENRKWGKIACGLALLLLFVAALRPFGFLVPAMVFFLCMGWYLGFRRPVPLLLTGILFPLGLDFLFNNVLMILLPANPFFLGE